MNIAMIYAIAALLAIVFAAPVALLAPVLFAVTLDLPADATEGRVQDPTHIEALHAAPVSCAPFGRVYAARGESRPTVHPWSLSAAKPLALHVDRNARPLKGAARASSIAKASRRACISHACPVTRSVSSQCGRGVP